MRKRLQPELPLESGETAPAGRRGASREEADAKNGPGGEDGGAGASGGDRTFTPDGSSPFRRLVDRNFLAYASYVICDRAIPAVEDGLKPVQRRILHSLHEKDDGRFTKVANIVGHTMQYHPHGDASIGEALVGLVNKGYLVEGQGNFGNVFTGDEAAASRYIECRLTDLARNEVFNDALTDFVPSYDGRNREPVLLPTKLPLLLMLGAEGIAVGLSTRIFTHNFVELLEAQIAILNRKPFALYPDFVQGGMMDVSEYEKGNGRLRLRARIQRKDEQRLVITQLPAGTTTEALIASIEDAVRKKKAPIKSISDFTSEKVEIELTLLPEAKAANAIRALYAFTDCETSVSGRVVVLRRGRPCEMDVEEVLRENTARLLAWLEKELRLKRRNLEDEWHEKTLVQIFVENRLYKRIEACRTLEDVYQAIRDGLEPFRDQFRREIVAKDIEMLLGVRIRRISQFDIEKNRREKDDIVRELERVEGELKDMKAHAVRYLRRLLKAYGEQYPRRTEMAAFERIEVRELTAKELQIRFSRETGYLGFAVEGDPLVECSSLDKLLLVWDDGRYQAIAPPEKLFVDKNLLRCEKPDREKIFTAVYTQKDFGFTYLKRFAFGGTILNKVYRCTPEGARIVLLADDDPETIFVKYAAAKGQRIHQQAFHPRGIPVKSVKATGNQMTAKAIERIATTRPRWWEEEADMPRGMVL